jgi:hypothetical protein
MLPDPADDPADQEAAERREGCIRQRLILRHARQHGLAVARGELDQRVEIGLLAFEPAAEGADGCADLGALRLTTDVRLSGGSAIGYAKDG